MQKKQNIILTFAGFNVPKDSSNEAMQNRKPSAAGRFYSNQPGELKNQLQHFFSNSVHKKDKGRTLALIVPHAGYVFSGEVAASAYNQIDPNHQFERIFIIGSSHTTAFPGASVYCSGNYETPFGSVKADTELAKKLVAENKLLKCYPEAHLHEHSIEVQLPFLQHHLKTDFKIVPVIIGNSTAETAKELAAIFKPYLNEKNLFVISSDFSHYPSYEDAFKADKKTAEAIKTNHPKNLISALERNKKKNISGLVTSLCGWSSALTLLYMTDEIPDLSINLIQYKNSGDSLYGDKERVVGYYAISFSQEEKENKQNELLIDEEDKKHLLALAHMTVKEYILKGTIPEIDTTTLSDFLKTPCGAFVTLYINHQLRGCVGRFDATQPLWRVVQTMAKSAASQNHRFKSIQHNELKQLKIEISVLSPLKRIQSTEEFILGKHGIYMTKDNYTGTFLPQVADKTGWSKEEFLGHCARDKAGIGWNGWETAELYTYEAIVFGEKE